MMSSYTITLLSNLYTSYNMNAQELPVEDLFARFGVAEEERKSPDAPIRKRTAKIPSDTEWRSDTTPDVRDRFKYHELSWSFAEAFIRCMGAIGSHQRSYDDFTSKALPEIIASRFPFKITSGDKDKGQEEVQYEFSCSSITVEKPVISDSVESGKHISGVAERKLWPGEALLRGIPYMCCVYADIAMKRYGNPEGEIKEDETELHRRVLITRIPCMVKSSMCHLAGLSEAEIIEKGICTKDPGGYFICDDGTCYNLITQERLVGNKIFVLPPPPVDVYRSFKFVAECRSENSLRERTMTTAFMINSENEMFAAFPPYVKVPIPAGLLLRAIAEKEGLPVDKQSLIRYIVPTSRRNNAKLMRIANRIAIVAATLDPVTVVAEAFSNSVDAKQAPLHAEEILTKRALAHNEKNRTWYCGDMILQLALVALGERPCDDRDSFANKVVEPAGRLLESLVQSAFSREWAPRIQRTLSKHPNIRKLTDDVVSGKIIAAVRSGIWTTSKSARGNGTVRQGVSAMYDPINMVNAVEDLRKMTSSTGNTESARVTDENMVNVSHWGIIDPVQTPESKQAGKIKHAALLSIATTSGRVDALIRRLLIRECQDVDDTSHTRVFFNGELVGSTETPKKMVSTYRDRRDRGIVDRWMSIAWLWEASELRFSTAAGRMVRPLLTVDHKDEKTTLRIESMPIADYLNSEDQWSYLLTNGYVAYVDKTEEHCCHVALVPEELDQRVTTPFDYCEIHPATLMGISSGLIPFPECSMAPRLGYQAAMNKQAASVFALNLQQAVHAHGMLLHYPQKQLAHTKTAGIVGTTEVPAGQNLYIAVMSYDGHNNEDGIILNKAAVERGLFCITNYVTHDFTESYERGKEECRIEVPPESIEEIYPRRDYTRVGDDGIIREGSPVSEGTVLISAMRHSFEKKSDRPSLSVTDEHGYTVTDVSVVSKINESSVVDKVERVYNEKGNLKVIIRLRSVREIQVADKVDGDFSQKATVSRILPQEDMPIVAFGPMAGVCPDLLINSSAIPSRRTINMIAEMLYGTHAAMYGYFADATAFSPYRDETRVQDIINDLNLNGMGPSRMMNGKTGDLMTGKAFVGFGYYLRLKHMILDKLSSRGSGTVTQVTRQPANAGRKQGMALTAIRLGLMEADALTAHGALANLRGRLGADSHVMSICSRCGHFTHECCGPIQKVRIPYVFKLFTQILRGMGIKVHPRIKDEVIA